MLNASMRQELIAAARQARESAYAPYSGDFKVGAAVLTADGRIFTGCNIENASFGASICAERVAIFAAVAAGRRQLQALAVIADTPQPIAPCGLCRQVLMEFAPDCQVIMANLHGAYQVLTLDRLLPFAFKFPPVDNPITGTE
jgi:cytidine deaminase